MKTETKHRRNDMNEIKAIISRNPDWLRRRAHRDMLLAMVQRINRDKNLLTANR
jgi:lipoate synthase